MALPKSLQPKFKTHLERFGRDNDGGYLVTKNSIKKAKTLISFGVLDDCSFETDFAKIKKIYPDNKLIPFIVLLQTVPHLYISTAIFS